MDDALIRKECALPLAFLEYLGYESVSINKLFLNVASTCDYLRERSQGLKDGNFLLEQKEFGFIRSSNPKSEYDSASHYYFNHLTFRDYFAARFLIQCFQAKNTLINRRAYLFSHTWPSSDGLLLEEFLNRKRFEPHYEFIWWFMAGILAIQRDSLALKKLLCLFLTMEDKAEVNRFLLLLRCLDEAFELTGELPKNLWSYIEEWFKYIFHPLFNLMLLHNQSAIINTLKISPSIFFSHNIQSFFHEEILKSDVFALRRFINFFCRIGLSLSGLLEEALLERFFRLTITMERTELRFWQILIQEIGILYKRNFLSFSLLRQKYQEFDASSEESAFISAVSLCAEASPEEAIAPSIFKEKMYQLLIDSSKPFHQRVAAASMLGNGYELGVFVLLKQKEKNEDYLTWDMSHFFIWDISRNVTNILTPPILQKISQMQFVDFELRFLLQRLQVNANFAPFFESFIFKKDISVRDKLIVFLCWICSLKTSATFFDLSNLRNIFKEFEWLLMNSDLELEKENFSEFLSQLFSPEIPLVFTTFIQVRNHLVALFLSCFNKISAPTIKKYLALTLACHAPIPHKECPMVFNTVICNSYSPEEFINLSPKILTLAPSPMLINELSFCQQDCTAFLDQLTLDPTANSYSLFLLLNKTPTRAILKFAVEEVLQRNEIGFRHLMTALVLRYLVAGQAFYLNTDGICYVEHHRYQVFPLVFSKREKVEELINDAKANLKLPGLSQAVIEQLSPVSTSAKLKSKEKKKHKKKGHEAEIKQPVNIIVQNQMVEKDSKKTTVISNSAVAFAENSSVNYDDGSGRKSVFYTADKQFKKSADMHLQIRGDGNMAAGFGDVVNAIKAIKAVYIQYKKAERVDERFKMLLDNVDTLESILEYPGLSNALYSGQAPEPLQRVFQRIDGVLKNEKHAEIQKLAQGDGFIDRLKKFFTADGNFRKYEDFLTDIDVAVSSLQLTLVIQGFIRDETDKKEKEVFHKWLSERSEEVKAQLKAQEEALKTIFDAINSQKPGDRQNFIDEVYGQCAVAKVAGSVALKVSKTELSDKEEIAALYDKLVEKSKQDGSNLKVFFKCAVASELDAIAVHMDSGLPPEDWDKAQKFGDFFISHKEQKSKDSLKGKEKDKEEEGRDEEKYSSSSQQRQQSPGRIAPKATTFPPLEQLKEERVEGISYKETEKGFFRVIINYDELRSTSEEEKAFQEILTGRYGQGSRGHRHVQKEENAIIMDELSEGCISELLFRDENSAKSLQKELNRKLVELRQQQPSPRGVSHSPKG